MSSEEKRYKDEYDRKMRKFEEEMKLFKEQNKMKFEAITKGKIKWKYTNTEGLKCDGEYEGQLRFGRPNGLGRFTSFEGNWKIEGEWRDGRLHGKTIQYSPEGDEIMYKKKDGKLNGSFIWYNPNGSRKESEWRNGREHGKKRFYTETGDVSQEIVYAFGKQKKNRLSESMAF